MAERLAWHYKALGRQLRMLKKRLEFIIIVGLNVFVTAARLLVRPNQIARVNPRCGVGVCVHARVLGRARTSRARTVRISEL